MAGTPIADAMVAARAFAAKRPTNAKLGVVVFNGDVKTLLEPTTDPALIKQALASPPELGEGTKINDALVQSRDVLSSTGAAVRSVVLLSDGADVGSKSTSEEALSGLKNDKARVFAVGLKSPAYDPSTLQAAAEQTGGTYAVAKTSKELASRLLRHRLQARQRVPRPVPVVRVTADEGRRQDRRRRLHPTPDDQLHEPCARRRDGVVRQVDARQDRPVAARP